MHVNEHFFLALDTRQIYKLSIFYMKPLYPNPKILILIIEIKCLLFSFIHPTTWLHIFFDCFLNSSFVTQFMFIIKYICNKKKHTHAIKCINENTLNFDASWRHVENICPRRQLTFSQIKSGMLGSKMAPT